MSQTIPLSHFEELMLHQDSAAFPASCFLKLRFIGRLDRGAFTAAVHTVIARHPLLHATVNRQQRPEWRVGDVAPHISWTDGASLAAPTVRGLDLTTVHGVRFFVQLTADRSDVLIQFHHACCDGIAIYQVARELVIAYSAELLDRPDYQLPLLDEGLLAKRESTGLKTGPQLRLMLQQAARLPSVWNFFARTPAQLVPHEARAFEDAAPQMYPAVGAYQFDTTTSTALKSRLSSGVTMNDVLTRDLFLAMRDFRRQQRVASDHSWLRLMVPTSLRRPEQYRSSAANMIGSVFLERRGPGMQHPEELLQGLQRELAQIKRLKLGYLFNLSLYAQRQLPGGLRQAARPSRCQVSAVFTNIGRVFTSGPLPRVDGMWECGNVILESTEASAPIARNVCAAFSATWYANRLSLTLHHDPGVMSQTQADIMLNLFVRRVVTSAGGKESATAEQLTPVESIR